MRFACGDMRDHIVSYQNDHGPSYWRRRALRQPAGLRIDFSEILRVVRFSTFATVSGVKRTKRALAITRFSRLNSEMRYVMEKVPGRDMWAVIDSVTRRPALVNDVPQIDLELDDADDLTDLLNRLYREASVSAKH